MPNPRPRVIVTSAMGVAQILAWGTSYYLLAVMAGPIATETGWPLSWIVGGLSLGFLVSGLASPKIGRLIEQHGGRPVLSASAAFFAFGLLLLAASANLATYLAGWILLGLGIGAGLYDPAFSTLGRLYGEQARPAITQVTLFGGFASTVCWPLSAVMVDHIGWRGACTAYAAIHLLITLPLYWFAIPAEAPRTLPPPPSRAAPKPELPTGYRAKFRLLASGLTLAAVIMTVVSVHLLTILRAAGMPLATAVALGALIGPAQVAARVIEMLFGRRHHPLWSMLASSVMVVLGLAMFAAAPGIAGLGIVFYGAGSGIRSIARGTVPLALCGREGYAVLMGRLAMPTLIAQAASPFLGAILLDRFGADTTIAVLVAAAIVNLALTLALMPHAWRK